MYMYMFLCAYAQETNFLGVGRRCEPPALEISKGGRVLGVAAGSVWKGPRHGMARARKMQNELTFRVREIMVETRGRKGEGEAVF